MSIGILFRVSVIKNNFIILALIDVISFWGRNLFFFNFGVNSLRTLLHKTVMA